MAEPKTLSYTAILTLAANTMNGPGITTLPDVAADAGRTLFVALIALSVAMAAFVCRRMVYAMWASVDDAGGGGVVDAEKGCDGEENYESMNNADSDIMNKPGHAKHLSIADNSVAEEQGGSGADEIIPEASSAAKDQLTHREHDHAAPEAEESHTEGESLLTHKDHDDNMAVITGQDNSRPVLENTAIVGQTREAFGSQASIYSAFTMVASALCLGLAQMMLCAGIIDGMFVALSGKSCALGLPSEESPSFIYCTTHSSMKPYLGSDAPMSIVSIGWVIAATASVAMGSVDLDEMMGVQYFLFGCLVVAAIRFSFVLKGMADSLGDTVTGDDVTAEDIIDGSAVSWFVGPNPFNTIGSIMFNFAFVVTSPPSSAMAPSEKIAYGGLGMSCVVMGSLYAIVGLSGASVSNAVRNGLVEGGDDSNLLSLILLSGGADGPSMLDLIIIALFGFSTIASVPVYCLLAKETLVNDAGVAPFPSFLLSNVLPWILVALTYNAAFFEAFVNWSGLLILGYANFSIPLLLDLKLINVRALRALTKGVRGGGGGETTAFTKGVFTIVTASISMVIVQSIMNSMTMAVLAFLLVVGLMTQVQL